MDEFSLEDASVFLPKYLAPENQKELFEELKQFPKDSFNYYDLSTRFSEELLQGDVWQGFTTINFGTLNKTPATGLVISNSCDVDINNPRAFPVNILFSPLISLNNFKSSLLAGGNDNQKVEDMIQSIKAQTFTSIFYLPESPNRFEESIILLDNINKQPLSNFVSSPSKNKLSTLTMQGFYLLLIKLSIHFSRMQEGVERAT